LLHNRSSFSSMLYDIILHFYTATKCTQQNIKITNKGKRNSLSSNCVNYKSYSVQCCQVLQFYALQIWSVIFMSVIFSQPIGDIRLHSVLSLLSIHGRAGFSWGLGPSHRRRRRERGVALPPSPQKKSRKNIFRSNIGLM